MTSDTDGTVKHQIPHITTSEVPSYEQTNGPTSNGDDDQKNGNNNGGPGHGMPMRALHHRQLNHHQTIVNDTTEM
jgi:hypothetical protein